MAFVSRHHSYAQFFKINLLAAFQFALRKAALISRHDFAKLRITEDNEPT